jgi:hypothetical protein
LSILRTVITLLETLTAEKAVELYEQHLADNFSERRANAAADQVESQVLQLFEADTTLESPAVCSAI